MIVGIVMFAVVLLIISFLCFEVVGFSGARLRRRLEPDEQIWFESRALRGWSGWASRLPRLNHGYLIVTDKHILFGLWTLPFLWETINVIPLKDIDEVTIRPFPFKQTQVNITAGRDKLSVVPRKRRIRPVGDLSAEFLGAIKRGRQVQA